jgi:hypothetical protein
MLKAPSRCIPLMFALALGVGLLHVDRADAKVEETGDERHARLEDWQGNAVDQGAPAPPPGPKGPKPAGRGRGDRPVTPAIHHRPQGACVTGRQPGWYQPLLPFAPAAAFNALPDCFTGGPPPPTPRDAAFQAWYWQTTLPDPTLATSPPDAAITGLDLYLAIGGPQTITIDVDALGYAVHLDVTSVYDIDWGEPRPDSSANGRAVTRNHPTQGGPYPSGDLRHQYIERGSATITVTQKWTAHWSAGGESGTIADRLATSASRTIPIQEIQAVLTGASP